MNPDKGRSESVLIWLGARIGGTWWWLGLAAVIFAAMFGLYYYPEHDLGSLQPVSFSHRVHAGVKQIDCRFCHSGVMRSSNAGLPGLDTCLVCHEHVIPLYPEIERLKDLRDAAIPVRWVRVYWVPDFVFFNHMVHVDLAQIDCSNCHGNVKMEDRLKRVDFEMGFCIDCHKSLGAQVDCWLACHR